MNLFEAIFAHDTPANPPAHLAPAIHYQGRNLTYGELRARTLRMVQTLISLGTTPGDRVALLLNDSPEFIEAFIATCSLGAIAVPINMSLRLEEQCSILHNSGARLALMEEDICNTFLTDARERLRCLTNIVIVDRKNIQEAIPGEEIGDHFTVTELVFRDPPLRIHSLSSLLEQTGGALEPEFPTPQENDPAFILYTSGSTGEPKGAVHRQADIFYTNQTFCREVLRVTKDDRLFSSSRLPFAYGLGNSLTFPLLNGATTILCSEKPTPDVIAHTLATARPTIFFAVPVVYNLLLDHHRSGRQLDCSSLRLCVSAGEALPAHLGEEWEREFGVQLLDGIGSTEMLHMFMSNHENDVRYGSSGRMLEGYEARLLDENGEPTPDGVEGNLWIKGDSASRYYWERPDETARTFVEGWVRTGDLYRRDSDGYWFHMGRSDDCFKSSGQWVSPVEVEGVLLRSAGVSRVAVVEDFDEHQLPCACAFVVRQDVKSDPGIVEKGLRDLAAASLARFKQPRKYVFVDELPYTATGKIQRFKLRQSLRNKDTDG
ncbi:MAG TPA: benzoate-CoA ligase family protein [Pyrinomonadaceae bacterium]|nr:benzoate-CoA ligase family protein [Pyrinomonadaceae bacterium]